ncbi:hypothetical protein ISCGN_018322 [Ixodes scapularis]
MDSAAAGEIVATLDDIERIGCSNMNENAWIINNTGADEEQTLKENLAAFQRVPRRPGPEPKTLGALMFLPSRARPPRETTSSSRETGRESGNVVITPETNLFELSRTTSDDDGARGARSATVHRKDCRLIIFGTRAAVGKLADQGPAVPVRPVTSPKGPRDLAQFAQQGSSPTSPLQEHWDPETDVYHQKSKGALQVRRLGSSECCCGTFVTLGSTPYPGLGAQEVTRHVRGGHGMTQPTDCRWELYRW